MPQRRPNQTRRRRGGVLNSAKRRGVLNSAKRRGAVWVEAAGAVCEVIAGVVKRCFSKKKNNNNNNRNYNYMNGYGPSNASFTAPKRS
jgi:hypothetical protein